MRLNVVLELRRRTRWLLIFDNAETRDQVKPLLPGGIGHVLITTRRDGFRSWAASWTWTCWTGSTRCACCGAAALI